MQSTGVNISTALKHLERGDKGKDIRVEGDTPAARKQHLKKILEEQKCQLNMTR